MKRTTITLEVIRDTCLGYEVYRGSALARDILEASWIDFHDPEQNHFGYQRDFDVKRSGKARNYAEDVADAFWPESILAIRADEELDLDDREKVEWVYQPQSGAQDKYGLLSVTYTEGLTSNINGKEEPWRRAFSQVDCQHRLGSMSASQKEITFCIIPGISRHEEAKVFQAINQNQKAIPTSLVDTIIRRTEPNPPAHILWAWDLNFDLDSPFRRLVDTGGRGQQNTLIKFRGLQQSLQLLIPRRHVDGEAIDFDQGYIFAKNYWSVIKQEWPNEFEDKAQYKMMVNPGVRALSRLGRKIFQEQLAAQDFRKSPIENFFRKGKHSVDWQATGPLQDATERGRKSGFSNSWRIGLGNQINKSETNPNGHDNFRECRNSSQETCTEPSSGLRY